MQKIIGIKFALFLAINFLITPFTNCMRTNYINHKGKRKKCNYDRKRYSSKKDRQFKNKTRKYIKKINRKKEKVFENTIKKENKFVYKFLKTLGIPLVLSSFCFKTMFTKDVVPLEECIPGVYLLVMISDTNTWAGVTNCFCIPSIKDNCVYLKCSLRLSEKKVIKDYDEECEPGIYRVYVEYPDAIIKTTRPCTCKKPFLSKSTYLDCNDYHAHFEIIPNTENLCDSKISERRSTDIDPYVTYNKYCKARDFQVNNALADNTTLLSFCKDQKISSHTGLIPAIIGAVAGAPPFVLVGCGLGAVATICGVITLYKIKKHYANSKNVDKENTQETNTTDFESSSVSSLGSSTDFTTSDNSTDSYGTPSS